MGDEDPFLSMLALDVDDYGDSYEWFADRMLYNDGANIFADVVRAICKIAPECVRRKCPFVTSPQLAKKFRINRREVHEKLNMMVDHGFMKKFNGGPKGGHRYFFQGGDIGYLRDPLDKECIPVLLCEKNRAVIKEVWRRES